MRDNTETTKEENSHQVNVSFLHPFILLLYRELAFFLQNLFMRSGSSNNNYTTELQLLCIKQHKNTVVYYKNLTSEYFDLNI